MPRLVKLAISSRRLANLSISTRIAVACLVPLTAFMVFAGKELVEKRGQVRAAENAAKLIEVVPNISSLVHELQKERGASAGFVSSKGQALAGPMRNQRQETDTVLAIWRAQMAGIDRSVLGGKFGQSLMRAETALATIGATRRAIDALAITAPKTVEYYSTTIANLLTTIEATGDLSEDGRIVRQSIALSAFMQRKEFAGQERAIGTQGFSNGAFPAEVYLKFVRLGAGQEAQAQLFAKYARPDQVEALNNTLRGPAVDDVARLRAIGTAAPFDPAAVRQVSGQQWFDAATKQIDLFKTIEDRLVADFLAVTRAVAAEANWGFWTILSIFLGMLTVTIALVVVVALSITRPLAAMVATMSKLADGHLDIDVEGTRRRDEIGAMAVALVVFRDAAVEKARLEQASAEQRRHAEDLRLRNEEERRKNAEVQVRSAEEQAHAIGALAQGLAKLADGNLMARLDDSFTESYRRIKHDFDATVERLQHTIVDIARAMHEVADAAGEISASTSDLSQRTEEQAASLEQTSASMEQISATVKKNAENAQHANQFASETREVAERGSAVVNDAVGAMARIEESSRKIADIIVVIDEIARQTNLLALNAAVESARAGEAGRGFAVVATEVRSLAQRSSQAAKDINDLITSSSSQVKDGVDLVNRAGNSLADIVASIEKVAGIVSDIATASAEQATGLEQINKALSQMDEVTQQNSALVEQNAATAKTLEYQSAAVTERLATFQFESDMPRPTTMRHAAA
jgi:methyl-accepting chemotaxis protein